MTYLKVPAADGSAMFSGPGPILEPPLCNLMFSIFARAVLVLAFTKGCGGIAPSAFGLGISAG